MTELRSTTIKEIEGRLDNSYFRKESFEIRNNIKEDPFLVIVFRPKEIFRFEVTPIDSYDGTYSTNEAPGQHMTTMQEFRREGFPNVLDALDRWVRRIQDDLKTGSATRDEVEEVLESLRKQLFTAEDIEGNFEESEITTLRKKLDSLQTFVEEQAEKLEANEFQLQQFEMEISDIKNDLSSFPKSIWYKVAGNKILSSMRSFLKNKETRTLLLEGIKKSLE